MRIVLTGGGSGGHFYPVIAVAEAMREKIRTEKLVEPIFYFLAPDPYDKKSLFDHQIIFIKISAGKLRRYFSILNFFDFFKTGWGIIKSIWKVFWIYPDVIFSKGGYGSFPVVLAGKILGIPVIIHESDSVPGKVNAWAGKFANKIAVSYPEAEKYFPGKQVAWTGNPIRTEIATKSPDGAYEFLDLEKNTPVILILGGSLGSEIINDTVIDALPELIKKYQVIHQVGKKNIKSVTDEANLVLDMSQFKNRYKPFGYLDDLAIKMSVGVANIIVSRAGSTIFEIANWGIPSIIIPIADSNGDHQRQNAYNYARSGGGSVIEESNLNSHILIQEINRIFDNKEIYANMERGAKSFAKIDAAKTIANEIIDTALTHEK